MENIGSRFVGLLRWVQVVRGEKRQAQVNMTQYIPCIVNSTQDLTLNYASLLIFVKLCIETVHICGSGYSFPHLNSFSDIESNIFRLPYDRFPLNGSKESDNTNSLNILCLWKSKQEMYCNILYNIRIVIHRGNYFLSIAGDSESDFFPHTDMQA